MLSSAGRSTEAIRLVAWRDQVVRRRRSPPLLRVGFGPPAAVRRSAARESDEAWAGAKKASTVRGSPALTPWSCRAVHDSRFDVVAHPRRVSPGRLVGEVSLPSAAGAACGRIGVPGDDHTGRWRNATTDQVRPVRSCSR